MGGDTTPKSEPEVESGSGSPDHPRETVTPAYDTSAGKTTRPTGSKRSVNSCLTCRNRRIRCDQGKPTCQNCIRSQRQCEGYNQKLIFKEPLDAFKAPGRSIAPGPMTPLISAAIHPNHFRSLRSSSFEFDRSQGTPFTPHSWTPQSDDRTSIMTRGPHLTTKTPAKDHHHVDSGRGSPVFGSAQPGQNGGGFASDTDIIYVCDSGDEVAISSPPQELESFLLQGINTFYPYAPGTTLTTYQPSFTDSPLTNPESAAIFWHFVTVTAPTISLYESTGMYNGRFSLVKPVPGIAPDAAPEVTVWAESFPVMSFQHPTLLHAMLALASLQIAQLQKVPPTVAMRHFYLVLRGVQENLITSKKHHPATFACALLLAYFELWMGELVRWSSHLAGLEALFINDTKSVEDAPVIFAPTVNSATANEAAGGDPRSHGSTGYTIPLSPEAFEQLREIYWAQLRMEVYQSLLAPTQPHVSDGYWQSKYPPRAPIGDLTAVHGTSDHLTLLLRQVTEFAASERNRRARLSESIGSRNAGGWVPQEDADARKADLLDSWIAASAADNWKTLLRKLQSFKDKLGPEYDALEFSPDVKDTVTSPFGAPVRYRIHAVAGVWMNFYLGLIHLHLSDPSLPRHSPLLTAAIAAKNTNAYVDHIGQIVAGLAVEMDLHNATKIDGAECAVLIESCVPVLVAGIQTVDRGRRDWLVQYLSKVERLTGCQLVSYAKKTCESSWVEHDAVRSGSPDEDWPGNTDRTWGSIWQSPQTIQDRAGQPMSVVPTQIGQSQYGSELGDVDEYLGRLDLEDAYWSLDPPAFESAALVGHGHESRGGPERSQGGSSVKDTYTSGTTDRVKKARHAPLTAEDRERAMATRNRGACASCKRKRVRCDPRHLDATWDETEMKNSKSSSLALRGGGALLNQTSPVFEARIAQGDKVNSGGSILKTTETMKRSESVNIDHGGRPDPGLEKQVHLIQGNQNRAEESHLSADHGPEVAPRFGSDLETDNSWWSWGETEDDSEGSDVESERDVDPTARVCAILQRNKELVVREVALYCREFIGSRQIQAYDCNDGNGRASTSATGIPSVGSEVAGPREGSSTRMGEPKVKGKGRSSQDDEDDDDNEKRRPNKRQRVLTQDPTAGGLKLACPYFKRNPKGPKISQSCGGPGWNTIHRLKEHLYRRHVCVRCLRCGASFRTEDELVAHSRAATACTVNCSTTDPDDGFEKHQEVLLRRRWKVVNTTEDQWRHLYKILFPDDSDDLMPSPYYQDHRTIVDEFARFELFLRRETSRLLEERLNDSLLSGSASLDPGSLAGQLSNVVNEIQSAAIRSYREIAQVEPSEGGQAPEGIEEGSHDNLDHATSMPSQSVDILDILDHSTGQESSSDGVTVGGTEDIDSWYDFLVSGDQGLVGYNDGQGDLAENDWNFQC